MVEHAHGVLHLAGLQAGLDEPRAAPSMFEDALGGLDLLVTTNRVVLCVGAIGHPARAAEAEGDRRQDPEGAARHEDDCLGWCPRPPTFLAWRVTWSCT